MMDIYRIDIRELALDEGGGFLAWVPDLPGCMSDGETAEEAVGHCRDAITEWLDQARRDGIAIPRAGSARAVA